MEKYNINEKNRKRKSKDIIDIKFDLKILDLMLKIIRIFDR